MIVPTAPLLSACLKFSPQIEILLESRGEDACCDCIDDFLGQVRVFGVCIVAIYKCVEVGFLGFVRG